MQLSHHFFLEFDLSLLSLRLEKPAKPHVIVCADKLPSTKGGGGRERERRRKRRGEEEEMEEKGRGGGGEGEKRRRWRRKGEEEEEKGRRGGRRNRGKQGASCKVLTPCFS